MEYIFASMSREVSCQLLITNIPLYTIDLFNRHLFSALKGNCCYMLSLWQFSTGEMELIEKQMCSNIFKLSWSHSGNMKSIGKESWRELEHLCFSVQN